MSVPRVSILMPVFNGGAFVAPCLQGLERQSFSDFECVFIDDGSTDDSPAVLDEWAQKDVSRRRVIHRVHRGLVESLNEGLQVCRAPLVARMDVDDLMHPHRLELQFRVMEDHPEVSVLSSLVRHFPRARVAGGFRAYETWLNSLVDNEVMRKQRFVESPVAHPSVMFRRDLVLQAGGYRDVGWAEDYDLWLRLFERNCVFAKIPRYLLFWRDGPRRLSRKDPRYERGAFQSCKAHFFLRGPGAGVDTVILWGAGPTGRRFHQLFSSAGCRISVVIDIDPSKIGKRLRGSPIVSADQLAEVLAPEIPVLVCVASRGARELIRNRLVEFGLEEGQDFWCLS